MQPYIIFRGTFKYFGENKLNSRIIHIYISIFDAFLKIALIIRSNYCCTGVMEEFDLCKSFSTLDKVNRWQHYVIQFKKST